jgi:hypothetical protein
MSDEKPFARVVPADGRYYKVGGVIAKPSAPQDAEGDVRAINAAHESRCAARERKAAAKALREAADMIDSERTFRAGGMVAAIYRLRSRADAIERGE